VWYLWPMLIRSGTHRTDHVLMLTLQSDWLRGLTGAGMQPQQYQSQFASIMLGNCFINLTIHLTLHIRWPCTSCFKPSLDSLVAHNSNSTHLVPSVLTSCNYGTFMSIGSGVVSIGAGCEVLDVEGFCVLAGTRSVPLGRWLKYWGAGARAAASRGGVGDAAVTGEQPPWLMLYPRIREHVLDESKQTLGPLVSSTFCKTYARVFRQTSDTCSLTFAD
jgi:hypothetical protein